METIDLFSAINQMRTLSKLGKHFSFSFMSYNRESQESEGIVDVRKAKLRKSANPDEVRDADHKLFYTDCDTGLAKNCHQPLLMIFEGKNVILN